MFIKSPLGIRVHNLAVKKRPSRHQQWYMLSDQSWRGALSSGELNIISILSMHTPPLLLHGQNKYFQIRHHKIHNLLVML